MKQKPASVVHSSDWLAHFDEWLLVSSTRYYLGRMTAATCDFAERLAMAWDKIPMPARNIIQRDIEEAFVADDHAKFRGESYRPLGMDCDRRAWETVRAKWANNGSSVTPGARGAESGNNTKGTPNE